jgi:hypothetical protein
MARFLVTEKTELTTIFQSGSCHLGDRAGGVRDPGDAR